MGYFGRKWIYQGYDTDICDTVYTVHILVNDNDMNC
jgi:hypothetical protein